MAVQEGAADMAEEKSYEMTFVEQRLAARERIWGVETSEPLLFPDGTRVEDGKLIHIGPEAIVEDGKLIGFRP
jgi:hypothetical protein